MMKNPRFRCKRGAFVGTAMLIALAAPAFGQAEPATMATYHHLKNSFFDAKKSLFRADEVVQPRSTTLRQEMQLLFKHFDCQLPLAVQERIRDTNPDGYIPPDLDARLFPIPSDLPKYSAIKGQAVAAALASIQFPAADGKPVSSLRLKSSNSYATLNPFGLVDKSSDAVIYTMDCSGYLTSTFNLDVAVPAASLKTFAKGQASGARSVSVAQATVVSPVMAALQPTSVPERLRLSERERLEMLFAAVVEIDLAKPSSNDRLMFEVPREFRLLWASNKGRSSAQGEARVEGGGGAGFGVASVKATTDVGGSISRELTFESFDTYLLQDAALQPNISTTYGVLRSEVVDLISSAATSAPESLNAGVVKDRYEASFRDLTTAICALKWKADPVANGAVSTRWDKDINMCVVSFKPSATWAPAATVTLKVNGLQPRTPELWLTLEMPLIGKL